MDLFVERSYGLKGEVRLPGDKSISHRAVMLLSLSSGSASIYNFSFSLDCLHTVYCMRMLGTDIVNENGILKIKPSNSKKSFKTRSGIYLGNSGTSIRLTAGMVSGFPGDYFLYGDDSLLCRPMGRIIEPLRMMGAEIKSIFGNNKAPLFIKGSDLSAIEYKMPVASAQVKSCILLAGINASGATHIIEKEKTRDHTERMLSYLDGAIKTDGSDIYLEGNQSLTAKDIIVPGDISSAAFIIAAALITVDSEIVIRDVLYNDTRTGFIDAARKMGARISICNIRKVNNEEIADIQVQSSTLKGIEISGGMIPRLIDEIPVIAVMALFAEGRTRICDAGELRNKESDRIKSIVSNLRKTGAEIIEGLNDIEINGLGSEVRFKDKNISFESFDDHRIAMAFSLVGLYSGNVTVKDADNIGTSFPNFTELINSVGGKIRVL